MVKRFHVLFYGSVQGIFFRQKTFDRANSIGVSGFVRNLNDGSVEAVFEGDSEKIDWLLKYCKTICKITDIKIKEEKVKNEKGFIIKR